MFLKKKKRGNKNNKYANNLKYFNKVNFLFKNK
jgi:hypothetical protein